LAAFHIARRYASDTATDPGSCRHNQQCGATCDRHRVSCLLGGKHHVIASLPWSGVADRNGS